MDNQQSPDPLQQLQLIDAMIKRAKNQFSENGHMYLVWGWAILICAVSSFVLEHVLHWPYHYIVWLLPWLTFIYQFVYMAKNKRKRQLVVTYSGYLVKYVWIVFFVLMMLSLITVNRYGPQPEIANVMILIMYGMPTFLVGKILKFKPLTIGAVCCWLLAVLCLFIPFQYHILMVGAGVLTGWIVPGYQFRKRFNVQQ